MTLVLCRAIFLIFIPQSFGIICHFCRQETDVSKCSTLTECPNTEICEGNRTPDGRGGFVYTLGCIPKSICDRYVFGRRSAHVIDCCSTNYCNKNLFNDETMTTLGSGVVPTQSTLTELHPTTPYVQPVTCNICGDINTRYPCSQKDVSQNTTTDKCPADKRFCMTDYYQDKNGGADVYKRCVTETECQQKWISESADQDYCNKFGQVLNAGAFECHFCCTGDRCNTDIMPPLSTLVVKHTGETTLPPCVDHDQRCTQSVFQRALCNSTVPEMKKYATMTCPVSCNYCKEYIASIEPVTCNVCGDINARYPCSQKDISQNTTTNICPADKRFCMTDFFQDRLGGTDVYKRCVTETECQQKWISESADIEYCSKFGQVFNPAAFECHFCCTGDRCNTDIMPPWSTLVAKHTGK